jgi:hypothetical protein
MGRRVFELCHLEPETMARTRKATGSLTQDQLLAEIEQTKSRLQELEGLLAAQLLEREQELRGELDAVVARRKKLPAPPAQKRRRKTKPREEATRKTASPKDARASRMAKARGSSAKTNTDTSSKRRSVKQLERAAKKIYDVIAASDGVTRAEIEARLPRVKVPASIKKELARFGLNVVGTGPRKKYVYTASK